MSIHSRILAGCLALTLLTGLLGGYAGVAERRLGDLALRFYDDAFMSVSYLRAAQVGFAGLSAGVPQPAGASELLEDLDVARERAMSATGRSQVEALRDHVAAVLPRIARDGATAELAAIQAEFERVVETFAADGFTYRRRVGAMVAAELRRTWAAIGGSLLAALMITAVVSRLIAPPVRRAVRVAQAIAAGRLDNPIDTHGRGETADLLRALGAMQASIAAAMARAAATARIKAQMAEQAVRHAEEIAAQHARMEAAIDNMNQGLCLFDAGGRLAITNRRFAEMFGLPELGITCRQVFEAAGLDARPDVLDGTPAAFSCDLSDGRAIAVSQQAVAGGGWVATYEDVSERRVAETRMAHMARHDALTGLPNRVLFGERTQQALARARRNGSVALLCLDLDGFKAVNDTLGHPAGDALLRAVAQRLLDNVREIDLVVRLGGDEFAILQENGGHPTEATALAQRLVEVLGTPFEIERQQVVIGVSIGIALSEDGLTSPEALLKCADIALYSAKADGRGTWRFFESDMDARLQEQRALEMDLRHALAEEQFELFYQPWVRASGGIEGFEALLRWRHPERGFVPPLEFIPLAEKTGLIKPLGAWALRRACADAASWPAALKVAVNLSPAQFRSGHLADEVSAALAASGLPAGLLELEITESVLLQDDEAVLATLHRLRALGVGIAMDDFGTGYSSLGYLRRFPFDKIKIDQFFVRGLTERADCLAIVRAVLGLGRALDMAVIAEGVETAEQAEILRDEGCDELQGYLFSRPEPLAAVPALLRQHGYAAPLPREEERAELGSTRA